MLLSGQSRALSHATKMYCPDCPKMFSRCRFHTWLPSIWSLTASSSGHWSLHWVRTKALTCSKCVWTAWSPCHPTHTPQRKLKTRRCWIPSRGRWSSKTVLCLWRCFAFTRNKLSLGMFHFQRWLLCRHCTRRRWQHCRSFWKVF